MKIIEKYIEMRAVFPEYLFSAVKAVPLHENPQKI